MGVVVKQFAGHGQATSANAADGDVDAVGAGAAHRAGDQAGLLLGHEVSLSDETMCELPRGRLFQMVIGDGTAANGGGREFGGVGIIARDD
jgi:hypothetical protein